MAAGLVSAAIRRSRLTPANAQPSGMELGGAVTPREIAQGMSTEKCFFHLRTDRYCVILAVEIDTICESVARTLPQTRPARVPVVVRYAPWWLNLEVLRPSSADREQIVDATGGKENMVPSIPFLW